MKRIGLVLAAVTLALCALVLVVPWLIPQSAVRQAVISEIVTLTGRTPTIDGAIRLSLAPLPTVTVENVTIPALAGMPPLLVTQKLKGTLRLASLLMGNIEVSSLALENAHVSLSATRKGDHSWDFKDGVLASAAAGNFSPAMPIKSVRLVNSTIAYTDATGTDATTLMVEDATLNWSGLTDSMSAGGMINWRRRNAEVSVSISDPASLISGGKSDLRIKVRGEMLNLQASGNVDSSGRMEGKLAASGASLRETLRWLGLDLPEGHSLAAFEVQSPVTIDSGEVSLSDVQLSLDGNEAEGALTLQLSGPRPKVSGTLAADTLNLTAYSSEMQLAGGMPRQWHSDRINLKGLMVSDLDLRISSGETLIDKVKLGHTAAAVSTHDGLLDVALGEASAYGGTVKGRVTLKRDGDNTEFTASGNFDSVEMGKALGDLFAFHRLEGVGTGVVEVSATGGSVAELSRSLQGQANIAVRDGGLVGIDLADLMQKIEKRPLSARFESSYGGRTPFTKALASFKIDGGLARTTDCRLDNGNLSVTLMGNSDIASRRLDMVGIANWIDTDGADPFRLPFRVTGGWEGPMVQPDTTALIRRSGAAAPLLRSLTKPANDMIQDSASAIPATSPQ